MTRFRRCGFDFTRLSNEMAAQDAGLPTDQLVAGLRSDIMQRWTPPSGGYHRALTHVVIHGLDFTVPLGAPRCSTDETIRVVLDDLTAGGGHARFGIAINSRRLKSKHSAARPARTGEQILISADTDFGGWFGLIPGEYR